MGGLRLKKAVVATHLYFTFAHGGNMGRLALFATVAVVVPPPLGLVTASVVAATYGAVSSVGRSASRAFRNALGLAHPGDFDVLAEFNRIQREAPRLFVAVRPPQKTVFPAVEMR